MAHKYTLNSFKRVPTRRALLNQSSMQQWSRNPRFMSTLVEPPILEHPEISNAKITKDGDHMQGYIHLDDGEHIYFQSSGLHGLYANNIDKKTNVVLLHGKKYTSQTWNQNGRGTLQHLFRYKYGNLALDMPGYGNSSGRRDTCFESANIDWLLQCLQKFNITDNVVLVMPSMSGIYGLRLLFDATHSSVLSGIITVAPAFCDQFEASLFSKVLTPACIVYGEKDETGLHEISNAYLSRLPNGETIQIDQAPHACYLKTHAKQFHQILLDFLDKIEINSHADNKNRIESDCSDVQESPVNVDVVYSKDS